MLTQYLENIESMLDEAYCCFADSDTQAGLDYLFISLNSIRSIVPPQDCRGQIVPQCRQNGLARILYQDPFTRRSAQKPRGYPGDAVLLDFIYGSSHVQNEIDNATDLGREIHRYLFNSAPGRAVRNRRDMIAKEIDKIANRKPSPMRIVHCVWTPSRSAFKQSRAKSGVRQIRCFRSRCAHH